MAEKTQLDLELILTKYRRSMDQADRQAAALDRTLAGLVGQVNKVQTALNKIKTSGKLDLDLVLDTSAIDRVESQIKNLDSVAPKVDVQVTADTSRAETQIRNIDNEVRGSVEIPVTADTSQARVRIRAIPDDLPPITASVVADVRQAVSDIRAIDQASPTVDVGVTADTSTAETDIRSLNTSAPDVKIDTKVGDTRAIGKIREAIETLADLAVIKIAVSGGGGEGAEIINNTPVLRAYSDAENASRNFATQTGADIQGVGKIFDSIFVDNIGESRVQISGVAAELYQLGVPIEQLEAATRGVFNNQLISKGADFTDIIRVQNQLVQNGLVPNYTAASDLITTGFQQGANRADDFLDTLLEYSPNFAALKIGGAEALSLITQGLEAGTFNADKLGDTFKEMPLLITDALGNKSGATYDALTKLGLLDEAKAVEAGTMTGTQFAEATLAAVEEKGNDADLVAIFGTPIEDFGIDLFKNLDFGKAIQNIITPGAAQDASNTMFDTMDNAASEFGRVLEDAVKESLTVGGESLLEVADQFKTKLQEAVDLIQSGMGVGEAFEVAFEIPGFSDAVNSFISGLGNAVIELERFVASVLEATGNKEGAANLRADVTSRSQTQLEFDLMLADGNEDKIAQLIQTATDRGLDASQLGDAASNIVGQLIDQGDIDAAQTLLDTLNVDQVFAKLISPNPDQSGKVVPVNEENFPGFDPSAGFGSLKDRVDAQLEAMRTAGTLNPEFAGAWDIEISTIEIDTAAAQEKIDTELSNIQASLDVDVGLMDRSTIPEFTPGNYAVMPDPTDIADYRDAATREFQNLSEETERLMTEAGESITHLGETVQVSWSLTEVQPATIDSFGQFKKVTGEAFDQASLATKDATLGLQELSAYDPAVLAAPFEGAAEGMEALAGQSVIQADGTVLQIGKIGAAAQQAGMASYLAAQETDKSYNLVEQSAKDMAINAGTPIEEVGTLIASTGAEASLLGEHGPEGILAFTEVAAPALAIVASAAGLAADEIARANSASIQSGNGGFAGGNGYPLPASRASGGTLDPGQLSWVGEGGRELIVPGHEASILNHQTSEAIVNALTMLAQGGYAGGGRSYGDTNVNVTQIINTRSDAQSAGAADRMARSLRGMV